MKMKDQKKIKFCELILVLMAVPVLHHNLYMRERGRPEAALQAHTEGKCMVILLEIVQETLRITTYTKTSKDKISGCP